MTTIKHQVAMETTMAGRAWTAAFGSLMPAMAACFLRGDSTRNCWMLAQALGHDGPYQLQHFLSRGTRNQGRTRDHRGCSPISHM